MSILYYPVAALVVPGLLVALILYIYTLFELRGEQEFVYKQKKILYKHAIIQSILVILTVFVLVFGYMFMQSLTDLRGAGIFFIPFLIPVGIQLIGFPIAYIGETLTLYIIHIARGNKRVFLCISKKWAYILVVMTLISVLAFIVSFDSYINLLFETGRQPILIGPFFMGPLYVLALIGINSLILYRGIKRTSEFSEEDATQNTQSARNEREKREYSKLNNEEEQSKGYTQRTQNTEFELETQRETDSTRVEQKESKDRNPIVGLILNVVIVGSGTLWLRKYVQGSIQLGGLILVLLAPFIGINPTTVGPILIFLLLGCWIWGIVTAILAIVQK